MSAVDRQQQHAWWTIRQLAERWQVSELTIVRQLTAKKLRGQKIGGQWRVHNTAVEEYEAAGTPRSAPRPRPAPVLTSAEDPWGLYSSAPSRGRNR